MKRALPIKEWGLLHMVEDAEADRPIGICVIGVDDEAENEMYITEPIFVDLLQTIKKNVKTFRVFVHINQQPSVCFFYQGEIVMHNHDVQNDMLNIKEALDQIHIEIIMDSLVDAKLVGKSKKKGNSLKALEALIKKECGVEYNSDLINYMLRRVVYSSYQDEIGIRRLFAEKDENYIIQFIGAMKQYLMIEETQNQDLAKLLKAFDIKAIETAVNREITDRFFLNLL